MITAEDKTSPGRCNYCGTENNEGGYKTKEVIHRKWSSEMGRQYVGRTNFTVCADKSCGGYLQMGYEG